jgi:hypothetical protein
MYGIMKLYVASDLLSLCSIYSLISNLYVKYAHGICNNLSKLYIQAFALICSNAVLYLLNIALSEEF